jgi:hypothetical protein
VVVAEDEMEAEEVVVVAAVVVEMADVAVAVEMVDAVAEADAGEV